jgi:hypothetical protein
MQQGDVFQVGDEDQLYLVEAVTPSGTIYARPFDLYRGPSGEPLTLQESADLKVLFNDLHPEQEEGWEYCDIVHVIDPRDSWTGYECFAAELAGAEGKYAVASAASYFIRGEPVLEYKHEKSEKVHQELLDALLQRGWEIVPGRRRAWFHRRLKRKIDPNRPAEPERPGCLASLFGRRK